ncbi:cytochrome C [Melaminivora suipulveris]|uniref:Cytochrome C n=1 Tax=Melaminivora suipulveris TaxID=2109913 RepID=A0A2R3QDD8_9BURK|nr:c-type cytochrome [Melaminivora suipulveris]AVO49785.1 cytochrome C [Melaminivora suipulveris]
MRFALSSLCGVLLACATAQASAASGDLAGAADLAKANGCYSCHAAAEKIVGPSFVSVAEKYAGDKDASASLAQSIQMGSKGKWGRAAMPAHPSLSPGDVTLLANWVLAARP